MADYASRLSKLQAEMQREGAALAIFGPGDQMRYFSGWSEGAHERLLALLVPAQGEAAFLVPAINAQHAELNPAGIGHVVGWDDAEGWLEPFDALARAWLTADPAVALIDDELPSGHLLRLQQRYSHLQCRPGGEIAARLRVAKGPDELDELARAARLIDEVYDEVLGSLSEGITEIELVEAVLGAIRRRGSTPSFPPLVCFGANGAMPHHHSGAARPRRGDLVIIDIGCTSGGYCSDITRTVGFGSPSDPEAARIYETVFRAHHAARDAVRPGATGEAVDAAARTVIDSAGYGPYFIHRTGHGIGLSTHEDPYIVAGNSEPLPIGSCFSIEPGIYIRDRFGVRIENIVTLAADGARSLNAEPPGRLLIV